MPAGGKSDPINARSRKRLRVARRVIWVVVSAGLAAAALVFFVYQRDIQQIKARVASGSQVVETSYGPVEYATQGEGHPVLLVHATAGGYDQALLLGEIFLGEGFYLIAPSCPGYLRTPQADDTSAAGQADVLAALLDALFFLVVATLIWSVANLARVVAPLRSRLATLCALGVTVGAIGAFIRLEVYSALAERFRAVPAEEQAIVVELARVSSHLVDTTYTFTHLLGGAAFLLLAWALSACAGIPKWLVGLVAVPGLLLALMFLLRVTAIEGTFVIVLLMLLGVMVLGFALAAALPRAGAGEATRIGAEA